MNWCLSAHNISCPDCVCECVPHLSWLVLMTLKVKMFLWTENRILQEAVWCWQLGLMCTQYMKRTRTELRVYYVHWAFKWSCVTWFEFSTGIAPSQPSKCQNNWKRSTATVDFKLNAQNWDAMLKSSFNCMSYVQYLHNFGQQLTIIFSWFTVWCIKCQKIVWNVKLTYLNCLFC